MRRRKASRNPLARIARIIAIVRIATRAFKVARKVHRLRRTILLGGLAALVGLIVRRRRAAPAEPAPTYAPPPTPTVPPGEPPLDAAEGNGGTVTGRNLEAEKDS